MKEMRFTIRKKLIISNVLIIAVPLAMALSLFAIFFNGPGDQYWETMEYIFDDDNGVYTVQSMVAVLAVSYWVLVVESLIRQTRKDKTNTRLFGWLAVFFNLLAVAGYFIYRVTLSRCPECGRLQSRRDTFHCRYCGAEMARECTHCGTKLKLDESFCHKCGKAVQA